jgi:two-component system invasion response regulator UvrY
VLTPVVLAQPYMNSIAILPDFPIRRPAIPSLARNALICPAVMGVLKILVAEDHMIVRSGLQMLLNSYFKPVEITEVDNTHDLLGTIKKQDFDILVLDVHLKDTNSVSVLSLIRTLKPELRIIYFTMLPEEIYGKRLLGMGAQGFLSKKCSNNDIVTAIREVVDGKLFMSRNLKDIIAREAVTNKPLSPFETLSHREFETMLMLLDGRNTKDIATELSVQVTTVGTYKTRLFEKLKVESILDLNKMATAYNVI